MNLLASSFALLLSLTPLALPSFQEAGQAEQTETDAEKYLRLAREGRPVVRPQAARRLLELADEAVPRILAAAGEDGSGLADLGKDIVLVLGEFGDDRLRALCWSALEDRDFPWRPSAAQTLARSAKPGEAARFDSMLKDPIARVRVAGVEAQRELDHREALEDVQRLLADPNDRVRRTAAALLADWGQPCALYWILEDLQREDAFFALQTGKLARYDALKLLEERLSSTHEFQARSSGRAEQNHEAMKAMRAEIAGRCRSAPELPELARASEPRGGDRLGLELRSCRRGEFFLRWNADDCLYVGTGNPARVELPKGTVERVLSECTLRLESLEGQFWGEPGCDLEQFHYQPTDDARPRAYRVNKGPRAVEDLRPRALGQIARRLCATLPDDSHEDPRLDRLASRVRETLLRLGGELPAPDEAR